MKALQDNQQTSSYYRLTDVDMIRRLLNPPWHRRHERGIVFCLIMAGIMAFWAVLIELYYHHAAVYAWFEQLGYWQWTALLLLTTGLLMLGHWIYTTGRR